MPTTDALTRDISDRSFHRSTARALVVIDLLSRAENGLSLAELSREVGAPKSSLAPILHTIQEMGYADLDPSSQRYSVGIKTYIAGKAYSKKNGLVETFTTRMRKIVDAVDETCQMGVNDHGNTLYIAKVDSSQTVRIFSDVGAVFPLYCTAIGKCLISDMTKDELEEYFSEPFEHFTSTTRKNVDELWEDIEELHRTGVARDRAEITESLDCFAVPVREGGKVAYGLSVSVPSYRLSDAKAEQVAAELLAAKADLERMLS